MKHVLKILLLTAFVFKQNFAQQNCTWYFGQKAGIEFKNGQAKAITNSAMTAVEGSACISDEKGNLLFYCNADTIFNSRHQAMKNGTGLNGYWSSTQAALIVPSPANAYEFYVFTTDAVDYSGVKGLCYSIVNMKGDGGKGEVTEKNTFVFGPCSEKMIAVPHKNKKDFWILAMGLNTQSISAWHLSAKGLAKEAVNSASSTLFNASTSPGQMKASASGNMVAIALYTSSDANVLLYHFNNETGKLTDELKVKSQIAGTSCYGVEFSADGKKLFLASTMTKSILMASTTNWSEASINTSFKLLGSCSSSYVWGMQLGPDGKIYVAHDSWPTGDKYLGVVENNGDWKYTDNGFYLGGRVAHLGLPNVMVSGIIMEEEFKHEPEQQALTSRHERVKDFKEETPESLQIKMLRKPIQYKNTDVILLNDDLDLDTPMREDGF